MRMQFIKSVRYLLFFLSPLFIKAQSTYIPMGMKDYILLDRLEIKTKQQDLFFTHVRPYNRKYYTKQVEIIDSMRYSNENLKARLSSVDIYNMQRFLTNNAEWTTREDLRKPQNMFHDFFHSKGNLFAHIIESVWQYWL